MNKLRIKLFTVVMAVSITAFAQKNGYDYTIDLTRVVDNKVYVELTPPKISESEITFYLPKMIPGTYSIEDYGRFLSGIKAYDKKGNELEVDSLSVNSWKISKANKLKKLSYWIEDTWHTKKDGPSIFQPAGTNIEEGKNYVLNASGFFGYFEGMRDVEYDLQVLKHKNFYGGTGMIPVSVNDQVSSSFSLEGKSYGEDILIDHYRTENYDQLVDSPIMYAKPDTAVIDVAGTAVLVSVYSPNKMVTAKEIASNIEEVLMAQRDYLGGQLPVEKYAFLFYFTDKPVISYGALEHSYSSFYYMPEMGIDAMKQQLRDFAAHEFFHIVTPLTIHSDEIGHFDFNDPKMSRHLWLYEGMTEYFAGNCQMKGKLLTPEEYLDVLREKIQVSSHFLDTLAFTNLSLGALDTYADQYYNVYQKGALIGMCLDITLRELSDGAYGVQNMMADLSKKYGKSQAFDDASLFDVITEMTYPEVGEFLTTYVGGTTPIPYAKYFEKVGVLYSAVDSVMDYSMGITQSNVGINFESGEIYIQNEEALDAFGKALGLKDGDIIRKMNGNDFPKLGPEVQPFIGEVMSGFEEDKPFTITVERKTEGGEGETVELKADIFKVKKAKPFNLSFMEDATKSQIKLRNAWLGITE